MQCLIQSTKKLTNKKSTNKSQIMSNDIFLFLKVVLLGITVLFYNLNSEFITPIILRLFILSKKEEMKWTAATLALLPLASAQTLCFTNSTELRDAVVQYLSNPVEGTSTTTTYGHPIGSWCVGQVTDFTDLFVNAVSFNEDISSWDMSNAVTIDGMFDRAAAFNQDISKWSTFSVVFL